MTYFGTKTGAGVRRTRAAIAERQPFNAGGKFFISGVGDCHSMSGSKDLEGFGRLPDELRVQLLADEPSYIVSSFGTPIAWFTEGCEWRIPAVKYSVTTANHQTQCRLSVDSFIE